VTFANFKSVSETSFLSLSLFVQIAMSDQWLVEEKFMCAVDDINDVFYRHTNTQECCDSLEVFLHENRDSGFTKLLALVSRFLVTIRSDKTSCNDDDETPLVDVKQSVRAFVVELWELYWGVAFLHQHIVFQSLHWWSDRFELENQCDWRMALSMCSGPFAPVFDIDLIPWSVVADTFEGVFPSGFIPDKRATVNLRSEYGSYLQWKREFVDPFHT
jgi:hypothetical protein